MEFNDQNRRVSFTFGPEFRELGEHAARELLTHDLGQTKDSLSCHGSKTHGAEEPHTQLNLWSKGVPNSDVKLKWLDTPARYEPLRPISFDSPSPCFVPGPPPWRDDRG